MAEQLALPNDDFSQIRSLPGLKELLAVGRGWTPLVAEAQRALDIGPPAAAIRHDDVANAYWRYLQSLGERAKATAQSLGIDVDRTFELGKHSFRWEYEVEDHEVIEARYRASVVHLAANGAFLPASYRPMAMGAAGFAMPGWLVKLFALFGIDDADLQAVGETFGEELGDDYLDDLKRLFNEAFEDAADGKYSEAEEKLAEVVKKLLRALERLVENLDDFLERLARRLARRLGVGGAIDKAAKICARISSKVVPGVGWLLFALELLWLLLRNVHAFYV
jgi:hypothetical protein